MAKQTSKGLSMRSSSLKCIAAVAALAGATSSASATIVNVTWTGTVSSVSSTLGSVTSATDGLGLFGGGDLTGDRFTLVFTFDTSLVPLSTTVADPAHGVGGFQSFVSGATYGLPDAFSPSSITINGVTQWVAQGVGNDTNNAGGASTGAFGLHDGFNGTSGTYEAQISAGIGTSLSATPVSPGLLATPSSTGIDCGWGCSGSGYFGVSGDSVNEAITLSPTLAVVTDGTAAGAPEASTWAMMGLGFVGLGFAGYRSRRGTAVRAAPL